MPTEHRKDFGMATLHFTAISAITGAIILQRFGYAVVTLGFWLVVLNILPVNMATIPKALTISEIAHKNSSAQSRDHFHLLIKDSFLNINTTDNSFIGFYQRNMVGPEFNSGIAFSPDKRDIQVYLHRIEGYFLKSTYTQEREELLKHHGVKLVIGYEKMGPVQFANPLR